MTLATYVVSLEAVPDTSYTVATEAAPGKLGVETVKSASCHCTCVLVGQAIAMVDLLSVVTAAVMLPLLAT